MPRTKKVTEEVIETPEVQNTKKVEEVVVYDSVSKTIICIPVSEVTANHKPI